LLAQETNRDFVKIGKQVERGQEKENKAALIARKWLLGQVEK
jgi:hypothetical protein